MRELESCVEKIKLKKAPGPDGMAPELVKIILYETPVACLKMMNKILSKGEIPKIWKRVRVVLIPKATLGNNIRVVKYLPLCLLGVWSKLLQHLVLTRLNKAIEDSGGVSERQFGFRPRMPTLDAMKRLQDFVTEHTCQTYRHKKMCILVTFDIQNAFNTVPWGGLVEIVEKRGLPAYLRRMILSYLNGLDPEGRNR